MGGIISDIFGGGGGSSTAVTTPQTTNISVSPTTNVGVSMNLDTTNIAKAISQLGQIGLALGATQLETQAQGGAASLQLAQGMFDKLYGLGTYVLIGLGVYLFFFRRRK
jgi:hypothetical protein